MVQKQLNISHLQTSKAALFELCVEDLKLFYRRRKYRYFQRGILKAPSILGARSSRVSYMAKALRPWRWCMKYVFTFLGLGGTRECFAPKSCVSSL